MEIYNAVFATLLGASVGSFLNVLIYRLPKEKSVLYPPSACPSCGAKIKPQHNIPVLSYIFLRGRCASCGAKIGLLYPAIELSGALIFLAAYAKLGFNTSALLYASVFAFLLALSVIDIKHLVAYDSLNLATLTLAVAASPAPLQAAQNAALLAGAMTLLRFYLSYPLKKEAMGEADVIVSATLGALLGVQAAFVAVFLSAFIALPVILVRQYALKKDPQMPYIPFLALAAFICFFLPCPLP